MEVVVLIKTRETKEKNDPKTGSGNKRMNIEKE